LGNLLNPIENRFGLVLAKFQAFSSPITPREQPYPYASSKSSLRMGATIGGGSLGFKLLFE